MGEHEFGLIQLVTVLDRAAQKPRYLVTRLKFEAPAEIVRPYKRRMWTEALFHDLWSRDRGLGVDQARLPTLIEFLAKGVDLMSSYNATYGCSERTGVLGKRSGTIRARVAGHLWIWSWGRLALCERPPRKCIWSGIRGNGTGSLRSSRGEFRIGP